MKITNLEFKNLKKIILIIKTTNLEFKKSKINKVI